MTSLVERIVAVEAAFSAARVPHAFGGALALAFHTEEPRGTRDIDVNAFVAPRDIETVFTALPSGVTWDRNDLAHGERDGQIRVFWDDTPIDLFFTTHTFHDVAQIHVERVPFAGITIPILGATELLVFKAFFDRTKDWADIEAMVEAGTADLHSALGWLVDLLGADDARILRLRRLLPSDGTPGSG